MERTHYQAVKESCYLVPVRTAERKSAATATESASLCALPLGNVGGARGGVVLVHV